MQAKSLITFSYIAKKQSKLHKERYYVYPLSNSNSISYMRTKRSIFFSQLNTLKSFLQ